MRILEQVELCGHADGRRTVRLHHAWGTSEGVYRDGPPGEGLLAIGPDALWDDLGRLLAGRGTASLVVDPAPDPGAAARAGLAFLRQRGATRVVIAASGPLATAALMASREEGVAGVALVGPDALPSAVPVTPIPLLVVVSPHESVAGRRLCEGRPRAELYVQAAPLAGEATLALLCTFVLDAATRVQAAAPA